MNDEWMTNDESKMILRWSKLNYQIELSKQRQGMSSGVSKWQVKHVVCMIELGETYNLFLYNQVLDIQSNEQCVVEIHVCSNNQECMCVIEVIESVRVVCMDPYFPFYLSSVQPMIKSQW